MKRRTSQVRSRKVTPVPQACAHVLIEESGLNRETRVRISEAGALVHFQRDLLPLRFDRRMWTRNHCDRLGATALCQVVIS